MIKQTIAILFGGRSGEHEISLLSAKSVLAEIDYSMYDVIQIGITRQGIWMVGQDVLQHFEIGNYETLTPACLIAEPGNHILHVQIREGNAIKLEPYRTIDVIFPVLHGTFGEDGTLQGLLELSEIAYVGAGVLGSSVGMDKVLFKNVMRGIQIPVLHDICIQRKEIQNNIDQVINQCENLAPYPLFTKPANMGSSVGINKCRNRQQLIEGLNEASLYDRRVLVEVGLNKPMEIEVSVLGNENPIASLAGEIVPGDEFYTYDDKYFNGISILNIPAELPEGMMESIREIAVRAYKAIDCAGMARVDFLIEENGRRLFLNELNTIPGFTQISMYAKLWEASGIRYSELINRLIELAIDRHNQQKISLHQYKRREA